MKVDAHMIVRLHSGNGLCGGTAKILFYKGDNSILNSLIDTNRCTFPEYVKVGADCASCSETTKIQASTSDAYLEFYTDLVFPNHGIVESCNQEDAIIFKKVDSNTLEIFAFNEAYGYRLLLLQMLISGLFDALSGQGSKAKSILLRSLFYNELRSPYNSVLLTNLI